MSEEQIDPTEEEIEAAIVASKPLWRNQHNDLVYRRNARNALVAAYALVVPRLSRQAEVDRLLARVDELEEQLSEMGEYYCRVTCGEVCTERCLALQAVLGAPAPSRDRAAGPVRPPGVEPGT